MSQEQVWLITGASRGIGYALVKHLLKEGAAVVATARESAPLTEEFRHRYPQHFIAYDLDVTDFDRIEEVVQAAHNHFGRIDCLVNNAGYGQMGVFENVTREQIEQQFRTNVFGSMEMTRAVLPFMREAGGGHIFTITSISGLVADPGASIYCASKFALEGWMAALKAEVNFFGINVTSVEPGFFRTDFLDEQSSLTFGEKNLEAYQSWTARNREVLTSYNQKQQGSPDKLAQAMIQLAKVEEPPLHFVAGSDALERLKQQLVAYRVESERWATLSQSTDYE